MEEKTYQIGDKAYIQRPLVLGQIAQLLDLMQGTAIPVDAGALGLMAALGDKFPQALAVVLTEEGCSPRDKDIPALGCELAFAVTPEQTMEIIEHFFALNPLSSWLQSAGKLVAKIGTAMNATGSLDS